jgi:glycosyltransferase involved in cell wall biosynthesis
VASVDIVVPCYGYAHFLNDCVSSIINQDFEDFRILIINDASPDATAEVASHLASKDKRIEIATHAANRGLIATCNEGIDWAAADYFLLLSADDLLVPGCLRRAVSIMEQYPAVGLCHGEEGKLFPGRPIPVYDEALQAGAGTRIVTGQQFVETVCRAGLNPVGTSTAVLRTSVQKSAGYYRAELPHTSDFEMWMRVSAIASIARTDAVQGIRRHHGKNMSEHYFSLPVRDFIEREKAIASFFATAGSTMPEANKLQQRARRTLAESAYWSGLSHLFRGHWTIGVKLVEFACQRSPMVAVLPPVNYLLRTEGSFKRIAEILREAVHGKREASTP